MKDEEWLKRIKERQEDYSEPAPQTVWERLEKDLAVSSAPIASRRVPLYRRWELAAAVCLLAVSLTGLWMRQTSLPEEVLHPSEAFSPVISEAEPTDKLLCDFSVSEREEVFEERSYSVDEPVQMKLTSVVESASSLSEDTLSASVVVDENPENSENSEKKRRNRYRPSSTDKYHTPLHNRGNMKKKGWSLALAVGNTSGFAQQTAVGSELLQQQPSALSSGGKFDLSAISNGMLAIPEGQYVEFRNGIPYLSGNRHLVESVEHKQPISVGISVRKTLPKGFSVETGLTYTFLASDIVFSGSTEKLSQKLHYLGIPLRVNWSFWQTKRLEFYVSAGGAVEKCIYGKIGSEEQIVKPLQFSVMGAVGGQLNLSRRLGIYVEPGVSYFFNDGSSVETIRKETPCNFTLQGGIRFTY